MLKGQSHVLGKLGRYVHVTVDDGGKYAMMSHFTS